MQQIAVAGAIMTVHKTTNTSGQNRVAITYPNGSGTSYSVNLDGRIRLPSEYVSYLGTNQYAISVDKNEKVINIDPA